MEKFLRVNYTKREGFYRLVLSYGPRLHSLKTLVLELAPEGHMKEEALKIGEIFNMKENILLAPFTTFKIGGPARYFFVVKNVAELREAVVFAKKNKLPLFVLGGGSNVLISDQGFPGVVIKMEIGGIEYDDIGDSILVSVGAGKIWDHLVSETVRKKLWGLENLSGIPGTVGAAPIQNIGAYGVEVKTLIEEVEIFDISSEERKIFSNNECLFEYRESVFKKQKGKNLIVIKVIFKLDKNNKPNLSYKNIASQFISEKEINTPEQLRQVTLNARKRKMPDTRDVGTAGSFYAHPIVDTDLLDKARKKYPDLPFWPYNEGFFKIPAGWLLEFVGGYKGVRRGSVGIWPRHALVMVNYGKATKEEVDIFAKEIEKNIFEKVGIKLSHEVQRI